MNIRKAALALEEASTKLAFSSEEVTLTQSDVDMMNKLVKMKRLIRRVANEAVNGNKSMTDRLVKDFKNTVILVNKMQAGNIPFIIGQRSLQSSVELHCVVDRANLVTKLINYMGLETKEAADKYLSNWLKKSEHLDFKVAQLYLWSNEDPDKYHECLRLVAKGNSIYTAGEQAGLSSPVFA